MKRTLYDCFHARYPSNGSEYIYCDKGHDLKGVHIRKMTRGDPLVLKICQSCSDFEDMNELPII